VVYPDHKLEAMSEITRMLLSEDVAVEEEEAEVEQGVEEVLEGVERRLIR